MEWHIKSFQELSNDELYSVLKKRVDVFVVEQECPYPELDNIDRRALHCFLKIDDEIAACARILPKDTKYEEPSIGRVLVVEKFRNQGLAKQMMQHAIDYVVNDWNETRIKLQAQEHLKRFYSMLGFKQVSESYLDDGIPHIDMIWDKDA